MKDLSEVKIEGHVGTFYCIDQADYNGKLLSLMESNIYGEDAPHIIIDNDKNIILEDVINGFLDYEESLEFGEDEMEM